jgi:hypothetical protein
MLYNIGVSNSVEQISSAALNTWLALGESIAPYVVENGAYCKESFIVEH